MRWGGRAVAIAAAGMLAAGCSLLGMRQPPVVGGVQVGVASWYGPGFHGRRTANGEIYDQHELTAAHPTLPHGTRAMVTNLANGRAVEVRINDRGPFVGGRVIDLSYAAARALHMVGAGTVRVRIEVLARADGDGTGTARRARPAPVLVSPPPRDLPTAAYAVEVASLADRAKAEHLRRVLAGRFPDAFVSALDGEAGAYYRVRLGPYPLRRVALARAELVSRLGYAAIIVEHEP
jgi:rare lipoprotein A